MESKMIGLICEKCGDPFQIKIRMYYARRHYKRPQYCPACVNEGRAERMHDLNQRMTHSQTAEKRSKVSAALKERWQNLTPDQQQEQIHAMREWQNEHRPKDAPRSHDRIDQVCPSCGKAFQITCAIYKKREKEGRPHLCHACTRNEAGLKYFLLASARSPERREELHRIHSEAQKKRFAKERERRE